jgi:hypothetical protein
LPLHRSKEGPDSGTSQKEKARQNGVRRDTQQKLDRLARDFKALHEEVKAGKLSVFMGQTSTEFAKLFGARPLLGHFITL